MNGSLVLWWSFKTISQLWTRLFSRERFEWLIFKFPMTLALYLGEILAPFLSVLTFLIHLSHSCLPDTLCSCKSGGRSCIFPWEWMYFRLKMESCLQSHFICTYSMWLFGRKPLKDNWHLFSSSFSHLVNLNP